MWTVPKLEAYARSKAYFKRKPKMRSYKRAHSTFNSRVKRVINNKAESKFINTAVSSIVPISGTSTVTGISMIAQGQTELGRQSNQISIVRSQISGRIISDSTEDNDTWARIIIVRLKDTSGASAPVIEQYLQADELKSLKNMDEVRAPSFELVYDKRFLLKVAGGPTADGKVAQAQLYYSKSWKLGKKATFTGTAATQASLGRGALYMYLMTASATNDQPRFDLQVRVTFKDY